MQVNFIFMGRSESLQEQRLIEDLQQIPQVGESITLPDDPLIYVVKKVIHQAQNATAALIYIKAVKHTCAFYP